MVSTLGVLMNDGDIGETKQDVKLLEEHTINWNYCEIHIQQKYFDEIDRLVF